MLLEKTPYDSVQPEVARVGERGFKGMDSSQEIWGLPPGKCNLILNGLIRRDGSIISRGGFIGQLATPLAGTIYQGAHVSTGGLDYVVFASGGKLYSHETYSDTKVELKHSGGATSFSFPNSGADVRFARFGKWLFGVPGDSGGTMFRTDGVTAELLTPAFSLVGAVTAPVAFVPTSRDPVGAVGLGWAEKFFIGDTPTERNFSDGTTISVAWVKSTNATISGQRSKSNSDYAIQLDNDTANDQEYVESDQTGSTDVSDNFATNSQFARENHLFTVECEVAGSGGSGATPAVDAATPFAYVDCIVIGYTDTGGTTEAGGSGNGRITKRLGPVSEQDGGKFTEVFDFRDMETKLGVNILSYRLRFEQPFTDPSGHAVGAHVNRVAWKAPGRVWDVRGSAVYLGSNVAKDGVIYAAGTFLQTLDLVPGAIAATSNFRAVTESGVKGARWRVAVGLDPVEGVSAFRVRAWARVGTSKTSTYGTTSVVYSTNTEVVQGKDGHYFFEFDASYSTSGTNRYILQVGIEILDDIALPGAQTGSGDKLLTITKCSLTGHLKPGSTYTYRLSFRNNAGGGVDYVGAGTGPISVEVPAWAADVAITLNSTITGQGVTHLQVWRQGGDAPDGWYLVGEIPVAGGTDTNGYWRLDAGVVEDFKGDETLIAAAQLYSLNRDNPPTNGRSIAASHNRLFVAQGNRVFASWLYDADTDNATGRYWTLTTDYSDPELSIKGATFDLSSPSDSDPVQALLPMPVYHPNTVEGIAALSVWRTDAVYLLTGSDPSNFRIAPIVQGEGVGIRRPGAAALVRDRVWALTDHGLMVFDGRDFTRVGREVDGPGGLFGTNSVIGFYDEWVLVGNAVYSLATDTWTQFGYSFTVQGFLSVGELFYVFGTGGQLHEGGLSNLYTYPFSGDLATPSSDFSPTQFSVSTRWFGTQDNLLNQWRSARLTEVGLDISVDGDGTDLPIDITVSSENYSKLIEFNLRTSSSPSWRNTVVLRHVPRDVFGVGVGLNISASLSQNQVTLHGVALGLTQARARYTNIY